MSAASNTSELESYRCNFCLEDLLHSEQAGEGAGGLSSRPHGPSSRRHPGSLAGELKSPQRRRVTLVVCLCGFSPLARQSSCVLESVPHHKEQVWNVLASGDTQSRRKRSCSVRAHHPYLLLQGRGSHSQEDGKWTISQGKVLPKASAALLHLPIPQVLNSAQSTPESVRFGTVEPRTLVWIHFPKERNPIAGSFCSEQYTS